MKMRRFLSVVLMVSLLIPAAMQAASLRVAVVDMAALIEAHPDSASADKLLDGQLEDFQLERDEMIRKGEALRAEYKEVRQAADNPALSEEARSAKEQTAAAKRDELRDFEREFIDTVRARQKQLAEQEARLRRRIVTKLQDVVGEYAKEQGIVLVLDTSGAGVSGIESVVYADESMDITDAIIPLLGHEESESE